MKVRKGKKRKGKSRKRKKLAKNKREANAKAETGCGDLIPFSTWQRVIWESRRMTQKK